MFLPRIRLLPWILAALLPACRQEAVREAAPSEVAQVVAGAGDVGRDVVARVGSIVAEELPDLQRRLDGLEVGRFFVHVHADRDVMPASLLAGLHEDAPGFALLGRHQIHLVWGEMRRIGAHPRGVVRHEIVHELLDQYVAPNGRHIPRWFHEGLAQLLAGDTYLGAREEDLVWRVGARQLAAFGALRAEFPSDSTALRAAYAQSYSYVAWLERTYGLPLLLRVAKSADDLTSFERALVGRTGRSTLELEEQWRDHLLHGSGAPWRVLLEQWFSLAMIAALPILVLALMRRLQSEERAARRLGERARIEAAAVAARLEAERAAAAQAALDATSDELPPSIGDGDDRRSRS